MMDLTGLETAMMDLTGLETAMMDLTGLETRPAQTWGALRLVPLVRREPIQDLRLHAKVYGDELTVVSLPDRTLYTAYVPHAFVASWSDDGSPAASYGTQLGQPLRHIPIRLRRRMVRRVDRNRLRFLPLHLAVEGFLALHFGGPEIAWEEWSRQALAHTLSRFLPSFERKAENHIGELITDEEGRPAYLKTFRLSVAQTRRGYLLSQVAAHGWSLSGTAAALQISEPELGMRLQRAGFGYLLRQDVLDGYRKALNERPRRTRRGGAASPPA